MLYSGALAAKNLKEAQKGAIISGCFKLVTPLAITFCGLISLGKFQGTEIGAMIDKNMDLA